MRTQRLIASVTSEAGVGGSVRTSISPIQRDGDVCTLRKDGTVVSYGDAADDLLIAVRRSPDSAANDQALVLARKEQCTLELTGTWDSFGMRGTCSPGYIVTARFGEEQIVPAPFADISSHTMLPFAHVLWSSLWLGIRSKSVVVSTYASTSRQRAQRVRGERARSGRTEVERPHNPRARQGW